MDPIAGVASSAATPSLVNTQAINQISAALVTVASPLNAGVFGNSSTIVNLSGASQLFSLTAIFQDQLRALQPGSAESGIGRHFGSDVASLAAEGQFVVDTFNGVQNSLATLSSTGILGSSTNLATAFTQTLASVAQATFDNGGSTLTRLAQIGIDFAPSPFGGGTLSINLDTLKSAFASDAAGAFTLLARAAEAFAGVGDITVGEAQGNFATLAALTQLGLTEQFLGGSSLLGSANGGNLADLLLLESLASAGTAGGLQNLVALSEFNLVSSLIG